MCCPIATVGQDDFTDNMFLVLLDVDDPKQIHLCHTTRFDKQKVRITYDFEDTINYLPDFIYEEDRMYGPDCFVPDMKLVFKTYTYVVSMYCTSALKYRNSSPYTPSSVRMKNDLIFTPSVYEYLTRLKEIHFGSSAGDASKYENIISTDPLEEVEDEDDLDDFLLGDDEDEEDEDIDDEDEALLREEGDTQGGGKPQGTRSGTTSRP